MALMMISLSVWFCQHDQGEMPYITMCVRLVVACRAAAFAVEANEDSANDKAVTPVLERDDNSPELQAIYDAEAKFPGKWIAVTMSILAMLILLSLIKGGKGDSFAGVECGSAAYGVVIAATFVFLVGCTIVALRWARADQAHKERCG